MSSVQRLPVRSAAPLLLCSHWLTAVSSFLFFFFFFKVHLVSEHSVCPITPLYIIVQLALYRFAAFDGKYSLTFGEVN